MENKKFEIRNLKGTFDFLPEKQYVRNQIIDTLKKNFEEYGYLPLETPILNEFDLLKYKYSEGAEILHEVYRLTDQGKRDIGLRYDLTVPFCKVIALNKDLTMPFRRYEIGRVFRDGPVKAGRTREFYQCDVDVVGVDGRFIEIEQMQMVAKSFKELGIDIVIKWNNRKLMTGILEYFGFKVEQFDAVISLIDRLEKISRKELLDEFVKFGLNEEKVNNLLDLFAISLKDYKALAEASVIANLKEGVSECLEIESYIQKLNLQNVCEFSPTLARGLGIYTGTVFEFFDKEKRITSSLGGGGRYNKIITNFMDNGQEYPACGLSFGLEPIYYILSQKVAPSFVDVLIIPMGTEIDSLKIAESLRNAGVKTVVELSGRKVKKAFDYANKQKIKYVMVVGENEINSALYSLKNMETGEQVSLPLEKVLEVLSK
ncbi:MAG TPA: histidine--tRNA ligase [Clostridiales bacterium]|nr:histidine--tRNA ligase [Clostridiales bacterium]